MALEDIGLYWDLPNFDEAKFYYFRAVNLSQDATGAMLDIDTPVEADSKDDVIEMYYGWRWSENMHKANMLGFGAVSLLSWSVFLTANMLM